MDKNLMLATGALTRKENNLMLATRRASREEQMIKQINKSIDWPALVELLSPEDRTQYEKLKSKCQDLMRSELQ